MAYVTTADLKAWLDIGSTADDALLLTSIQSAQGYFEMQTGRVFEMSTASTHAFDAVRDVSPDGLSLYLDADLAEISTATNGDGVVVAPTEFVTAPRNTGPYFSITIKRTVGKTWTYTTDPENAIGIVGKWAYSVTPAPEIVHAVKLIAAQIYQQRANASDADKIVSTDGVVIVPSSIPKLAADVIRKYQRKAF